MKTSLYIVCLVFVLIGCKDATKEIPEKAGTYARLSSKEEFEAGEEIRMHFQGGKMDACFLWLSSAFGSTLLAPDAAEQGLSFTFPDSFSEKSGSCQWRLITDRTIVLQGEISILPKTKGQVTMETFLGPGRISAGGTDFSMLVTAPTDSYDNLLSDSLEIDVGNRFRNNSEKAAIALKNGIGWKNLYSPEQAGRLLITASYNGYSSKEMTAIVHPANATDFSIDYRRNHDYADGNQIIVFSTDVIKDRFGNTVSDGTLVTFLITNTAGVILKTNGITINGIAKGNLLHPDTADIWSVTAYVPGAAESNRISVVFKPTETDESTIIN